MKLYTIGFTKKTAEQFFSLLKYNNVQCLIDTRLHPDGQLSGFAKGENLPYFLAQLSNCEYRRIESLAPSEDVLSAYRKDKDWALYTQRYESLMRQRGIPGILDRTFFCDTTCCLLCSEATPEKCHRSLLANIIARAWDDVAVIHLT
jgi:uncharacterized protein (DUF488 family)